MKQVLVIGGGAAGMAAALELARRNIPSTVIERSAMMGGLSKELACKGDPHCVRCDACYPHDLRREAALDPLITMITGAEVRRIEHQSDGIKALVRTPHRDEELVAGAVIVATGALPYDADKDARLHHSDCPDVLSSQEVERALVEKGHLAVPSTGMPAKNMAIVQCVGSRDCPLGNALLLKGLLQVRVQAGAPS